MVVPRTDYVAVDPATLSAGGGCCSACGGRRTCTVDGCPAMCTDLSPPRGRHRWSVSTARSTSPRSADTRSRATWPRFTAQRCTGLVAANSVQARRPRRRLQPSQLGTHPSRPGRHRPAVSDGAQRDASRGPALRPRRACPLRAQARHRDRRHQPSPRSTGRRRVECDEPGETPPLLASRPGPRGRRVGESSTGRLLLTAFLERLAATKRITHRYGNHSSHLPRTSLGLWRKPRSRGSHLLHPGPSVAS
jgi:hypothetical protein